MREARETIHDYLRRRLSALRGQHSAIAADTGVPQSTISRIVLGDSSPRLVAVQPLLDWLESHDKAQRAPIPTTSAAPSRRRRAANGAAH